MLNKSMLVILASLAVAACGVPEAPEAPPSLETPEKPCTDGRNPTEGNCQEP